MKKKRWLKNQIDKNFFFTVTVVLILVAVMLFGLKMAWTLDTTMDRAHRVIDGVQKTIHVEDVEGYAAILNRIGNGLGWVGQIVIWVFLIVLPAVLAFFIFFFALIARHIYQECASRILAYRILMGFSFAGQILLLFLGSSLCRTLFQIPFGTKYAVLTLLLCVYLLAAILLGIRGTYTKWLMKKE